MIPDCIGTFHKNTFKFTKCIHALKGINTFDFSEKYIIGMSSKDDDPCQYLLLKHSSFSFPAEPFISVDISFCYMNKCKYTHTRNQHQGQPQQHTLPRGWIVFNLSGLHPRWGAGFRGC